MNFDLHAAPTTTITTDRSWQKHLIRTGTIVAGLAIMASLSACTAAEAEPLTVPDVVGLAGNEAEDMLEEAGLEADLVAEEGSVWIPSNWEVESTEPSTGEEIELEAEVTVHLIRPDDDAAEDGDNAEAETVLVTVPDVVGLAGDEAADMLEEAEIKADLVADEGIVVMPSNWEVEGTDPAAGEETDADSEVTVHLIRPDDEALDLEDEDSHDIDPETESAESLTEPEDDDIAERLEAEALVQFDVDSFTELLTQEYYDLTLPPYYAMHTFESIGSSTVRVHVQEQMTEAEEEQMARWFFNMTCQEVPELETVVISDINGVDSNFHAARFPRMPYC